MQPLDPQSPNPSGQAPQPPLSSSPYGVPPQPPQPPAQSPYGGPPQPPPYGGPQQPPYGGAPGQLPGADKKLTAGLCGIFLGGFGVHKFILGYNNEGIIMLAVSVVGGLFSLGLAAGVMGVVGLIEGIIYLTKSDEQFVQEYVVNKKPWF